MDQFFNLMLYREYDRVASSESIINDYGRTKEGPRRATTTSGPFKKKSNQMLRLARHGSSLRAVRRPVLHLTRCYTTPPKTDLVVPKPVKDETGFEMALREAKMDAFESAIAPPLVVAVVKKPMWDRVKEEALHYWHGSKLLAAETSISFRLLLKLLKGATLSRREYRQLKRTTGDLLR